MSEINKTPWEEAARRIREGKRHDLETLPGKYFHPIKYSASGMDEINAANLARKGAIPPKLLKKAKDLARQGKSQEEIMDTFTDEELLEFVRGTDPGAMSTIEIKRAKIKHGFGPNNFGGDIPPEGSLNKPLSEENLDKILLYGDMVTEIVGAIDIFNRPLASRQPPGSGTPAG